MHARTRDEEGEKKGEEEKENRYLFSALGINFPEALAR